MLFNLALKNIKQSFKDYAIYFFTLILGISIFYIFNSLESQTVMLSLDNSAKEIIKLMNNIISGLSVFVSFILGFLIIYANRFLIKRRKKEFGVYMILGMSKKQVSKILLGETICIGLLSLLIGLIIGVGFSQIMSIIIGNMFNANMNKFVFTFSKITCIKTITYFGLIYLLVMLFNTIQISKCKLIDLLIANKKSEEIKLKNSAVCILIFISSCSLLAYAYYNVTMGVNNLTSTFSVLLQMIYGALATFLIFWSLSGLLIKVVTFFKNIYFKDLNSFTIKEISSKINTNVLSTTIICLMLFITICIFSTSFNLNNSSKKEINDLAPADIQINTNIQKSIRNKLLIAGINIESDLKDIVEFNTYSSEQLKNKDTYGDLYQNVTEEFLNVEETIVKLSDYNKLAKIYNFPIYSLTDEYVVVCNYDNIVTVRDRALKNKPTISLNNKIYRSKFNHCQEGFLTMLSSRMNDGFYIVPDDAFNDFKVRSNFFVANYNISNKKEFDQNITEKLANLNDQDLFVNTRIEVYNSALGTGAMVIFIGLYIGVIFLLACAAIIALKELSQSIDNKEKYQVLRKLGVSEKMINKSLFRQMAIYFSFPMILAIIHSIFGIQVCQIMMGTFSTSINDLIDAIILTGIVLILIYGGYFLITYWCSKNIIKDD